MKLYTPTESEEELINRSTQIKRLTVLQKKSFSRLQMITYGRHICVKSINDDYQNFRLLLCSVLIKIYSFLSEENEKRLTSIKQIIYEAKLEYLVNSKGIQRQSLLKSVAMKLNSINVGADVEKQVIKMFNCVSFFDEIMIRAFEQKNSLIIEGNNLSHLQNWLSEKLNLQLVWNNYDIKEEGQNELYLIKQQNMILRPSMNQSDLMGNENQVEILSPLKKSNNKKLFQTISVEDSRSPGLRQKYVNVQNSSIFSNVEVFDETKVKRQSENMQQNRNNKKSFKRKNKRNSLWKILCCSDE